MQLYNAKTGQGTMTLFFKPANLQANSRQKARFLSEVSFLYTLGQTDGLARFLLNYRASYIFPGLKP